MEINRVFLPLNIGSLCSTPQSEQDHVTCIEYVWKLYQKISVSSMCYVGVCVCVYIFTKASEKRKLKATTKSVYSAKTKTA